MSSIKARKHALADGVTRHTTSLGAMLLAGSLCVSAAAAQESGIGTASMPAESDITNLPGEEVTGIASGYLRDLLAGLKFTAPIAETPKTILVIDAQLLEEQQATTLTEALRNSPGVGAFAMGETGSSSTGDAVYVRGVDASGSIFVDGVRDAGSITRDTFNTEQVEVVKGPDGSMFGRTALSGTVNMVTKQARAGERTRASLSGGTQAQKRATVDLNRMLGERTALRLNAVGENSGVPGRDKVKRRTQGIAPALAFGLGSGTRLFLDYLHVDQDNRPDGGLATLGLPGYHADPEHPEFAASPRPRSKNWYGTDSDYEKVHRDQLTAQLEMNLGESTLFHNITRWGRTRQDYVLSNFQADWDPSWDLGDLGNWRASRVVNNKDQENTILTNQAGFVHELHAGGAEHTLSWGAELTQERLRLRDRDIEPAAENFPINIYHPSMAGGYAAVPTGTGVRGRTTTLAGYVFDTVRVGAAWQFNGGLRLDRYRARYRDSASEDLADVRQSKSLFSWQLGAVHDLNELGNVYAQYAVAQQPPGTDGLVLDRKAKYADRPEYAPQKARTLEVGSKWKLADQRLLLSASLFRTDIRNQVEQDPVTSEFVQTGEKRVEGADVSLIGAITPAWDVTLGYTHMRARIVRGKRVAKDGSDTLLYTPRNAFSSWTSYHFPGGLTLSGGARYVGTMQRDAKGTPATPESIASYWVADAMVSYPLAEHAELQLNAWNLFDKDYVASIDKKGFRYVPGGERAFMLTLNLSF